MTTKNQFTAVYKKTKKWIVAWVEEIPGVNTQGKTMKEARENLQEAFSLVMNENRKQSRAGLKKSSSIKRELIELTSIC